MVQISELFTIFWKSAGKLRFKDKKVDLVVDKDKEVVMEEVMAGKD